MLPAQVSYWQNKENERHNKESEREIMRHNMQMEWITSSHNQVMEAQGWASIAEVRRHNVATENLQQQQINMQAQYNADYLRLQDRQLLEQQMHNRATEAIQQQQANVALMNARTNAFQASTAYESMQHSWALGLEANRIAQVNADTNKFRAESQAAIGYMNAFTNIQQLDVSRQKLELENRRFAFDREQAIWRNTLQSIGTFSDVLGATFSGIRTVQRAGRLAGAH